MKKNILYLLLLLVLVFCTYWFVFKKENPFFTSNDAQFTFKDTSDITKIFLSSTKGENIKLTKTEKGWILNDSLTPRPDAVNLLLETMFQQKATQVVPASYHDDAILTLSSNSTKVEVYEGDDKIKTFYVGTNPAPNNATYMLTENAEHPYIIKLPFQNTYVGSRYFTKLKDWRDKKILYKNAPIENITIAYADSTQYSYKVSVNDTNYSVTGKTIFTTPINKKRAKSYVGFFDNFYCYGFEPSYLYKDSTLNYGLKLATVTVNRKNEKEETLIIYFKPVSQSTKAVITLNKKQYDYNVFLGWLNNSDLIIIDKEMIEKMIRTPQEFYQQD